MRKYFLPVTVAAVLFGASNANAATASGNFQAKVTLNATCAVSATSLDFGTLPGLILGTETTTSTVSVKCSKGANYSLALDAGTTMVGQTIPADTVTYTAVLVAPASVIADGTTQTYTINGALPVQATPSAQSYLATRKVTVTY